jgi:hypothetical protein
MLLMLLSGSATAYGYEIGDLVIDHPWSRATSARDDATYMTLVNEGEEADRLVKAASPVATRAELHIHLMENNVMKMRPVETLEVHPGEPTVLRPGGLHIMLIGLNKPLEMGDSFPLTLTFEKAGSVEVEVNVEKTGQIGEEYMQGSACSVCAARHARHARPGMQDNRQNIPVD